MNIKHEYCKSKVLILNVGQDDVDGLLVNWDLNDSGQYKFMENEFINIIMNYLPEYSMGYDIDSISPTEIVPLLREASNSLIKIKRVEEIKKYIDEKTPYDQWDELVLKTYNSKGLFSELILHCILREFKSTIPLISKIYFKDSNAVEAHGFDAVHVVGSDELWLGETKFYADGKQGIQALIEDLNNHFVHDYLREQFVIISRSLAHNCNQREEWIQKITNASKLEEKFNLIRIPLLCIYQDEIATQIIAEINKAGNADQIFFDHISDLKSYFDHNNTFANKDKVQTVLILLPVESKDRIVSGMLSRIVNMQNI